MGNGKTFWMKRVLMTELLRINRSSMTYGTHWLLLFQSWVLHCYLRDDWAQTVWISLGLRRSRRREYWDGIYATRHYAVCWTIACNRNDLRLESVCALLSNQGPHFSSYFIIILYICRSPWINICCISLSDSILMCCCAATTREHERVSVSHFFISSYSYIHKKGWM